MKKEFISYKQALALKELGFDEPCFKGYTEEYKSLINFNSTHTNTSIANTLPTKPFTAPLYQQAFRWFRKKHNLCSWIYQSNSGLYHYSILKNDRYLTNGYENQTTYEEAELECLKRLIEIIKEKSKV